MRCILGAGSYGEAILELASDCGESIDFFVDDDSALHGSSIQGVPVVSRAESVRLGLEGSLAAIAVGSWAVRKQFAEWLRNQGAGSLTLVHPGSYVSPSADLGAGCLIHRDAFVWTRARLGSHAILSPGARVAHHSTLGEYSMISMGAEVGAAIEVGQGAFVGMGATVMTGVNRLGDRSVVGAGSVVIRDVPDDVTVVGVPARQVAKATARGAKEAPTNG